MRFNLRFLLLLSTASAVLFALLFALPSFWAGAATFVLLGAIPACLSSGVYFGTPKTRAFCIGALIPIVPNSILSYLIGSPAIFVAEEINWWNPRGTPTTAEEAFMTIQGVWMHLGHAMLAVQVPVWITAAICGGCALLISTSMQRKSLASSSQNKAEERAP